MRNEKRKSRRRPLRYSAWMALDNDKLHGCVLSDISDTGARLDVEETNAVPDRFMLLLVRHRFGAPQLPRDLADAGAGRRRV